MSAGPLLEFSRDVLHTMAGGRSVIDLPRLNLHTREEAQSFLESYGYDLKDSEQVERLWHVHRRALVLLQEKLGFEAGEIPEILRERKLLGDPCRILLWASGKDQADIQLQRWSCALLRVMHVFVHTENDLFASFSEEIQKQILLPFQKHIFHDGSSNLIRFATSESGIHESLPLLAFETKPFKTSSSAVIKLLAKPDALAMNIYDKLGVRFVSPSLIGCFRILKALVDWRLVSFPHVMPDQSTNSMYPVELLCEVLESLRGERLTDAELESELQKQLDLKRDELSFVKKENHFSSGDHRFIKFISRRLVEIPLEQRKEKFRFFFPFEVQILDQQAYQSVLEGPSHHLAYKERQRQAARKRVYPF